MYDMFPYLREVVVQLGTKLVEHLTQKKKKLVELKPKPKPL